MKKLLLTLLLVGMVAIPVFAQDVVSDVEQDNSFLGISDVLSKLEFKTGVAYSFAENGINSLTTVEVLKYKGFTLEAGVAGDYGTTDWKAAAVVSYPLLKLGQFVDIPILELVEANIGLWFGVGRADQVFSDVMDSETDYGFSLSLLNLKW